MMAIPSDELLLAATAKGDREAFDRLATRYRDALDGFFRRRLPDDGRVEELRQETLLALYALLPSYREEGRFRPLLFSIAYRKLASALRAQKPAEAVAEDLPSPIADPDAFEVRDAVLALPEGLREALLLTRFEGLSAAEAGDLLGCSAEAVRARVCRAKSLLARRLGTPTRRKR
ncbi:MAG: RNA polymerase sigma factor [Thermoanaerobaculia bacterium]